MPAPVQELAEGHVAAIAPRNEAQKKKDEEAAHQGEMGKRLKEAGAQVGALTCSLMWHSECLPAACHLSSMSNFQCRLSPLLHLPHALSCST